MVGGGLILGLGFGQADNALALLELAALAEEFHAFKAFQDAATGSNAALAFQTGMLAHKFKKMVAKNGWASS